MALPQRACRTASFLALWLWLVAVPFLNAEAADITGVLVTDAGVPIANLLLHLSKDTKVEVKEGKRVVSGFIGGDEARAETDSSGVFRFRNVPPGKYAITQLSLSRNEFVERGGQILVIEVPRDGTVNVGKVILVRPK